jgi:MarR family transcriptional regulator for hemolysin
MERAFLAALCPLREKLRRCYDKELMAFGLSRSLATPLMAISRHDGICQRDLAGFLDIEGPSLVRLLDQLTAAKLVIRRTDPADQRSKTLHLTPAGTALALRIQPVVQDLRMKLLGAVPTSDLQGCLNTIARFLEACEQHVSEPAR